MEMIIKNYNGETDMCSKGEFTKERIIIEICKFYRTKDELLYFAFNGNKEPLKYSKNSITFKSDDINFTVTFKSFEEVGDKLIAKLREQENPDKRYISSGDVATEIVDAIFANK